MSSGKAFAASLASFYLRTPVAHVEAGLRTHNKFAPFPEEINRVLASHIVDLHFAPTERNRDNLLKEGIAPDKIEITGNTVIDALLWVRRDILIKNKIYDELKSIIFCRVLGCIGKIIGNAIESLVRLLTISRNLS